MTQVEFEQFLQQFIVAAQTQPPPQTPGMAGECAHGSEADTEQASQDALFACWRYVSRRIDKLIMPHAPLKCGRQGCIYLFDDKVLKITCSLAEASFVNLLMAMNKNGTPPPALFPRIDDVFVLGNCEPRQTFTYCGILREDIVDVQELKGTVFYAVLDAMLDLVLSCYEAPGQMAHLVLRHVHDRAKGTAEEVEVIQRLLVDTNDDMLWLYESGLSIADVANRTARIVGGKGTSFDNIGVRASTKEHRIVLRDIGFILPTRRDSAEALEQARSWQPPEQLSGSFGGLRGFGGLSSRRKTHRGPLVWNPRRHPTGWRKLGRIR